MADLDPQLEITPFGLEVAKGNIDGLSFIHKFGRNPDIDAGTDEDVWDMGGTYSWPTSALTLTLNSTNANDTVAGTGARTIRIFGLDSSWDEQTEDITMNGTTGVNTINTYRRIYRIYVLTAGSNETNIGRLEAANGGTVYAAIGGNVGQTLMAIYSIPNAKTGYLQDLYWDIVPAGGAAANLEGEIHVHVRPDGGAWRTIAQFGVSTKSGLNTYIWRVPLPLDAKTDIRIGLSANDNNIEVNAGFSILLEDN